MPPHSRTRLQMADKEDVDVHSVLGAKGYEATCDFPSAAFFKEQLKVCSINQPTDASAPLTL
jgi:hypothetical protein